MSKNIFVYGDWESLGQPTLIGVLNVDLLKGKEIFSFEYDTEWLKTQKFSFFDPDLQLYKGRQYTQQNRDISQQIAVIIKLSRWAVQRRLLRIEEFAIYSKLIQICF